MTTSTPPNSQTTGDFRADINGLRGVAVLAVVLYHFQTPGFNGGYVGVDVFFVISGYFMARLVCRPLVEGRFRLVDFYLARMRRILPALVAMLAALIVFGYLYLLHVDYRLLAKHAVASAGFFSNVMLWRERGYFDSEDTWLLHTWSLSVEGQFYVLFPLVLIALRYFGLLNVRSIVALAALSFLLSVVLTPYAPNASFYLLHTRAWELLAGSLAYFFDGHLREIKAKGSYRRGMAWLGLAMIGLSVVFFSRDLLYPGHAAALPVAATVLALAGRARSQLLNGKIMQFFGNVSYSLYLWHWPLLVGYRYFDIAPNLLNTASLLCVSVAIAWLSYRLVELPVRAHFNPSAWSYGATILMVVGTWVFFVNGLPHRLSQRVTAAAAEADNSNPNRERCMRVGCVIGATGIIPSAVLWGDSHAATLAGPLAEVLKSNSRSALFAWFSSCPPTLSALADDSCAAFNKVVAESVTIPGVHDVFIVGRWSSYGFRYRQMPEALMQTACTLSRQGKNVYVIGPIPEMPHDVPRYLAKSLLLTDEISSVGISMTAYSQRHTLILETLRRARQTCGIHVLDPTHYLCDHGTCNGVKDGRPLYFDDHHLSEFGNRLLIPMLENALRVNVDNLSAR